MHLLGARNLRPAQPALRVLFRRDVVIAVLTLAAVAHWAGLRNWRDPLASWALSSASAVGALACLAAASLSVLVHELGHLAIAAARGDLEAVFAVERPHGRLRFVTYAAKCHATDAASPLAGAYAQACFAALLAGLAAAGVGGLRAPLVVVDCAVLLALVPMPGTDGARSLMRALRIRDLQRDVWSALDGTPGLRPAGVSRHPRLLAGFALFLALYVVYLCLTSGLLTAILYRWMRDLGTAGLSSPSSVGRAAAGILLLAPPVYLAWWGWSRLGFVLVVVSRFGGQRGDVAALAQRGQPRRHTRGL